MKSFVFPKLGTRLLRLLVVSILTISAVFSFVPQAMAQTPIASMFNNSQPRVKDIVPVETNSYQIYIRGTTDVFISTGNKVVDLSDIETPWPAIFSGSSFYSYDDGYSITLDSDYDYELAFVSTEKPIDLSVYRMDENGSTTEVVEYCNCSWSTIVAAQIEITSKEIGDLYYDQDGDGNLDTKVEPNVRDKNPNGVDLWDPEASAEEKYVNGELKLFLKAKDNDKIDRILYYYGEPIVNVDGAYTQQKPVNQIGENGKQELVAAEIYKNPIKINEENNNKTVFITAFDKVGNQSEWVQYTIGSTIPSINNTPIPKGSHDGDLYKFASDPLVYLVGEGDQWTTASGLIPFETNRMLNFYTSTEVYNGKTITYSQDDPRSYTRFVYSTVEKLSTDYIYNCKDHSYENGALVSDKGTVYIIMGCTKRAFASMEALTGLGYSTKNIVNGDLDKYTIKALPLINSKDEAHPWGSWINYKGVVYYAHSEGMIPVPSMDILASNGGKVDYILPATSADIAEISLSGSETEAMISKDDRLMIYKVFGPTPSEIGGVKSIAERRDEKRYRDTSNINWAIYNYYSDHEKVPDYLAQLVPDYIESIPQAPLPPDGSCTWDQNNYTYERISDDDYNLHYCYGGKLYDSYEAGPQSSKFFGQQ